jgi:hypothetical protein
MNGSTDVRLARLWDWHWDWVELPLVYVVCSSLDCVCGGNNACQHTYTSTTLSPAHVSLLLHSAPAPAVDWNYIFILIITCCLLSLLHLNLHPSTRSIHRRYPFASHRLSVVNYKILCPFSKTTKEGSYHGLARHSLESLCRPAADEAPLGILIRSVSSYLDDAKCNFAIHATKEIEKARVHNQSTVPRCLFIHTARLSDFAYRA